MQSSVLSEKELFGCFIDVIFLSLDLQMCTSRNFNAKNKFLLDKERVGLLNVRFASMQTLKMSTSTTIEQTFAEFVVSLSNSSANDSDVARKLAIVKVAARDPKNAPFVYCQHGIKSLAQAAFESTRAGDHPLTSLEASRIIANACLVRPDMQQVLLTNTEPANILNFYSHADPDHEFLGGRILFVLTYYSKLDYVTLIEANDLVGVIRSHLKDHISALEGHAFNESPIRMMALLESLKLVYNLSAKFSAQMHFFTDLIDDLARIINTIPLPSDAIDPPIAQLLHPLASIDWPLQDSLEASVLLELSRKLIVILDQTTSKSDFSASKFETVLVSLFTILRKINVVSNAEAKEYLMLALLPQDIERDKPLGQSTTSASRVLRLQTSAGLNVLPEAVSSLLFDLSDRDATRFIQNIGYGHAAGYLMNHQIPIPEDLRQSDASKGQRSKGVQMNPITGQRLDTEEPVNIPEMTDAEKEREAERLFVLFERLRATGVVNVENPLRTAQQTGRFEELSDDEKD